MARKPVKTKRGAGLVIKVQRLAHAEGLDLPAYQSAHAAGVDLVAALGPREVVKLKRGERRLVPTGLVLELPPGTEAQVRPRSGLAVRSGVTVLNSPGTIDSDYRGEVQVLLINHGEKTFEIRRGDRIAQLVIASVLRGELRETARLTVTERGSGGFGSTGTRTRSAAASARPASRRRVTSAAHRRPGASRPRPLR